MAVLVVFRSLADAIRAGYQIYDRCESGYVVRIKTKAGWSQAIVDLRERRV